MSNERVMRIEAVHPVAIYRTTVDSLQVFRVAKLSFFHDEIVSQTYRSTLPQAIAAALAYAQEKPE